MPKVKPGNNRFPIFVRDARVRSRVSQQAAELSVRFGRPFTQEDAIVYMLDQEQVRRQVKGAWFNNGVTESVDSQPDS